LIEESEFFYRLIYKEDQLAASDKPLAAAVKGWL
jgi:hypothetical protein